MTGTLRVALAAPPAGPLTSALRRAVLASGAEIAVAIGPADARSFGERAQAFRDAHPGIALIGLGGSGDADELALVAEALRFGCAAQQPAPRAIVASGDTSAIARMRPHLDPFEIETAADVRREDGRRALAIRLRAERTDGEVAGDAALETLAEAASAADGAAVLLLHVGGSSTSVLRAEPDIAPIAVHVRSLGVGSAADRVVVRAGLERVRRWIPWPVDQPALLERAFERATAGKDPVDGAEARAVGIALAHEAIRLALADATAAGIGPALRSAKHVIVSGYLAELPPRIALLVVADSLDLLERTMVHRTEGDGPAGLRAIGAIVPSADIRRSVSLVMDPGAELAALHDSRPRPLALPLRDAERIRAVSEWYDGAGVPVDGA